MQDIHRSPGQQTLLLEKDGGFTQQVRNPDSWEGWYWGSKHVWATARWDDGAVGQHHKRYDGTLRMILLWGATRKPDVGFHRPVCDRLCYFWTRSASSRSIFAPISLARHPCGQMESPFSQYRRGAAAGDRLHLDHQGTYDKEYVKTYGGF